MSNVELGRKLGVSESYVRKLRNTDWRPQRVSEDLFARLQEFVRTSVPAHTGQGSDGHGTAASEYARTWIALSDIVEFTRATAPVSRGRGTRSAGAR